MVPPFVGVAVNVTEAPVQIAVALATIETAGITTGFTVIEILFDVADAGEAQVLLDVMITVTASPLFKVEEENVDEFVPTLLPLTCH